MDQMMLAKLERRGGSITVICPLKIDDMITRKENECTISSEAFGEPGWYLQGDGRFNDVNRYPRARR